MLPQITFSSEKGGEDEDNRSCVICLEDYDDGDALTILPCFHRFHTACVTSWILADKVHQGCPMCKQSPFQFAGAVPGTVSH